jgi:hypothetical protein
MIDPHVELRARLAAAAARSRAERAEGKDVLAEVEKSLAHSREVREAFFKKTWANLIAMNDMIVELGVVAGIPSSEFEEITVPDGIE